MVDVGSVHHLSTRFACHILSCDWSKWASWTALGELLFKKWVLHSLFLFVFPVSVEWFSSFFFLKVWWSYTLWQILKDLSSEQDCIQQNPFFFKSRFSFMICLTVSVQFCVIWIVTVAIMCSFDPREAISCLILLFSGKRTYIASFLYWKLRKQGPNRLVKQIPLA